MVVSGDEEAEEEEEESSDVGSVCGRDVVYGLRARGMGGLPAVEKAAARRRNGRAVWSYEAAQGAKVFEKS